MITYIAVWNEVFSKWEGRRQPPIGSQHYEVVHLDPSPAQALEGIKRVDAARKALA